MQTFSLTRFIIIAVSAACCSTAIQAAPVFDPAGDFSATAPNPNGVWSYGFRNFPDLESPFLNLYLTPGPVVPGVDSWREPPIDTTMGVFHNGFGTPRSVIGPNDSAEYPAGTLGLHPGPNGQYAVVRFTAPANGTYKIEGTFFDIDTGPGGTGATTDVHLLENGFDVAGGLVNGAAVPEITLSHGPVTLAAGDTLEYAVGAGLAFSGGFFHDSTGLKNARVSAVLSMAYDFNDCLLPPGASFPGAGNAGRIADDGTGSNCVVHLTDANQGDAFGVLVVPFPFSGASNVDNIHLHWRSLVGGDTGAVCGATQFGRPGADGYSMSWGTDLPNPPSYGNPGEEGAGAGLIVTVDTFDNGGGEAPGLEIKWRGARVAFDNINPDQGLAKDFLRKGVFVEADLTVDTAGQATFTYDGRVLRAPLADWGGIAGGGCIMFAARTGGACDNHWIDDLLIEKLRAPTNPATTFAGLLYSPVGSATTVIESNRLVIGNLGASGQDGVRIELGQSEGWQGSFRSLDLSPPNTMLRMVAHGEVGSEVEHQVGLVRMYCSSNSALGVAADFSAIGSLSSTVEVRDRLGEVVSRFSVPNDTAITFQPVNPADMPIPCLNSFVLDRGRPTVWCRVCRPVSVLNPEPGGAGVIEMAAYCIFADAPFAPVQSISSIELTGQGLASFSLEDEALRVNGLFHSTGVGNPGRTLMNGGCNSPFGDFCPNMISFTWIDPDPCRCPAVVIDLKPSRSYFTDLVTGSGPAVATQPGAYLRLAASGNLGGLSTPLGELRMTRGVSNWTMTADYSPAGSTSQRVELYNRGMQVAGYTGHIGDIAQIPALPDGCGKGNPFPWPPGDPCFLCIWRELQPIVILGVAGRSATIMADEIRVLAENTSAPLRYLESFTIETAGIPSFALSNEKALPAVVAPLQISRQTNGVLITIQTEVNRNYRLEYTAELEVGPGPHPWAPPPSPWKLLQTVQGNGLIQTVLDPIASGGIPGGGCRFYRLNAN